MSSFANEAQKVQDEDRERNQWRRYSAAKSRVRLEGLRDIMLRSEAIDLKEPQTAEVLEYVMKKVIKIENDLLFIEKVLCEVRFFQELKKSLSTEIYRELVKSVNLKEVKPNELVLFQSLEKKSQTLNSSNFYVILKGQVIEFQKKTITSQQTQQQSNDTSNPHTRLNTESNSPKTRIPSQQANYNNPNYGGETTVNRGKKFSIDPFNSKDPITSKNTINSMSQSPRKFSPPPMKRTQTFKKIVIEADQQQILMRLNELLESIDEQSSFSGSGSGSYKNNHKLSRFQNSNSPQGSPRKTPNSSSPKSPRSQQQQPPLKILRLNMQSMDSNEDTIYGMKDRIEEGLRNQPLISENNNTNKILEELFSECKKHFLQMRATSVLSQGDNFGEFDKGNLNLIAHGYISRTSSYLIELTGEIYNNLVQKHREKEMEMKIKFLQQFSCFKRYSKQKMKNVLKLFVEKEYFRGNTVYFEDESAEFIYFVKSGEVELSRIFSVEENETEEEKQDKDEQLNEQVKGYNNGESNEEIMHYLCQGKRLNQMSKLLKNISLTILKDNSYFGEAEVLSQSTRRCSATVVSVNLLALTLPAQVKQMTKKAISITLFTHNF